MRIIGKAFSVFGLADDFRREVGGLVKDEFQLVKAEMSEKLAIVKKNCIALGIGIFVSFAGIIVMSLALGRLLGLAFVGLGWSRDLANVVGVATAGVVIAIVGAIFLLKAIKSFSKSTLKPERTIETIRDLRGENGSPAAPPAPQPAAVQPSKEELEARINYTRAQLKDTTAKAKKRLAWASASAVLGRHVRRHPMRALAIGACAGIASRAIKMRRSKAGKC